jgi:hypothetical protein
MQEGAKVLIVVKAAALSAMVFALACSKKPDEPAETRAAPAASAPSSPAVAPAATAAAGSASGAAGEIAWTDPPGWPRLPSSSPMRKATYKVPAAAGDGDDGEVAVFYFRGEGGSTEANIQRWIGQFPDSKPADAKRTQRNVKGMSQTIVEVEGTYSSGMPGGPNTPSSPKPGYRLIGAVVETPAGPYFFKLTGPKKTIEAARGTFLTMLDSVKAG